MTDNTLGRGGGGYCNGLRPIWPSVTLGQLTCEHGPPKPLDEAIPTSPHSTPNILAMRSDHRTHEDKEAREPLEYLVSFLFFSKLSVLVESLSDSCNILLRPLHYTKLLSFLVNCEGGHWFLPALSTRQRSDIIGLVHVVNKDDRIATEKALASHEALEAVPPTT